MIGFVGDIEKYTLENTDFRKVLFTGQHLQLVVMMLKPTEDIGSEIHSTTDQFLRIEEGMGKLIMNGHEYPLKQGDAIVVPAGTQHNIINTSSSDNLKIYTVYAPPHHRDGTVHTTKEDAQTDRDDHL